MRVLEERRGMYLIELFEDGRKKPGKYLISKKWAQKILDIEAVLQVARLPKLIEEAVTPLASVQCVEPVEPLEVKDEEAENIPEIDKGLESELNSSARMAGCLKGVARDSEIADGLYRSLSRMMSMKGCSRKIRSIYSKNQGFAANFFRPISGCSIELNFSTRNQSEGVLVVELENGEKVDLDWKSHTGKPLEVDQWLYHQAGQEQSAFLAQTGFQKICPESALTIAEAKLAYEKLNPSSEVAPAAVETVANEEMVATPESIELEDEVVVAVPNEIQTRSLTLQTQDLPALADIPIPERNPRRVVLPVGDDVPIPTARPLRRVPIPERRPTVRATPKSLEPERRVSSSREACRMSGVSAQWVRNCEKLYSAGIPKDALDYALNVMKLNDDSFESNKCYKVANSSHYSMRGVTKRSFENKMAGGLPNKCQMVINDTRQKLGNFRARMYYIDLCSGSSPKVTKTYFNMGTGTFRNNYADSSGEHTTVKGAFFTNYKSFSFQKNNAAYQRVKSRVRTLSGTYKAPSVQLFGLQNSNNNAGPNLKYMHVSGYQSSWGCPSIAPENYWMIEKLANNGPSLVLNYGTNMENINRCTK